MHAAVERRLGLLALQVAAIEGEILLVSQFTLYGRLKKPKPDYSKAMGPDQVLVVRAGLHGVPLGLCSRRHRACVGP
jgi:D-Tyr-tRNAtyr deacylase